MTYWSSDYYSNFKLQPLGGMCGLGLPLLCEWGLRSYGIWCSVDWYLFTDQYATHSTLKTVQTLPR